MFILLLSKKRKYISKGKDGSFSLYPEDNANINYGIIGEGETIQSAIAEWYSVYKAMKKNYQENNRYFQEANFEFYLDIPSFIKYYGLLFSFQGLANITGVNATNLQKYANEEQKPSYKTQIKIYQGFENIYRSIESFRVIKNTIAKDVLPKQKTQTLRYSFLQEISLNSQSVNEPFINYKKSNSNK